jgi:GxxExxY protein
MNTDTLVNQGDGSGKDRSGLQCELTDRVIGAAFTVSNAMGCGFLEKVYENALAIELTSRGMDVKGQRGIEIRYRDQLVGFYVADLIVEERVIVEVKALDGLDRAHYGQCINYLKATGLRVCLLLNFGRPRLEVKRLAL